MACQKRLVMLQRLIRYWFCPQVYLSVHLHSAELSAPAAGSARTGRQWLHEGRWRGNSLLIPSSEDGEKGEWFCLFVINLKMITSQRPESWNYVPYECDGCCHNATIPEAGCWSQYLATFGPWGSINQYLWLLCMIICDTMMAILSSGLSEGSSHQVIAVSSVYGTVWV